MPQRESSVRNWVWWASGIRAACLELRCTRKAPGTLDQPADAPTIPSLPSAVLIHLVWSGPRWFWCCSFINHTLQTTNLENETKKSWERWKQRGMEGSQRQSGKWKNQDGGAVVQNLKRREFAKGRAGKGHFISSSSKTWVSARQSLYKTKIRTRSFGLTLLNAQILLKNSINTLASLKLYYANMMFGRKYSKTQVNPNFFQKSSFIQATWIAGRLESYNSIIRTCIPCLLIARGDHLWPSTSSRVTSRTKSMNIGSKPQRHNKLEELSLQRGPSSPFRNPRNQRISVVPNNVEG